MITQLSDINGIGSHLVDDSVLVIDPARPVTRKSMLERLRFSNSFEWFVLDLLDEGVDAAKNLPVRLLPVQVILPSIIGKYEFQSDSSRSVPSPPSS